MINITSIEPSQWRRGLYGVNGYDFTLEEKTDCDIVKSSIMTRYNDYFHIGTFPEQPVIASPFYDHVYGPGIVEWESEFHATDTPKHTLVRLALESIPRGDLSIIRDIGLLRRTRCVFKLTAFDPERYQTAQTTTGKDNERDCETYHVDRFQLSLEDGTRKELARAREAIESLKGQRP